MIFLGSKVRLVRSILHYVPIHHALQEPEMDELLSDVCHLQTCSPASALILATFNCMAQVALCYLLTQDVCTSVLGAAKTLMSNHRLEFQQGTK
jgi:hypothetical protein